MDIVAKQCVKVLFGQICSIWVCAKWVPKLWILSEKSKNFDKKSDPNQSEPNHSEPNHSRPNQSKPNQSKPNQSNWNFLKSPRAPWSYFFASWSWQNSCAFHGECVQLPYMAASLQAQNTSRTSMRDQSLLFLELRGRNQHDPTLGHVSTFWLVERWCGNSEPPSTECGQFSSSHVFFPSHPVVSDMHPLDWQIWQKYMCNWHQCWLHCKMLKQKSWDPLVTKLWGQS